MALVDADEMAVVDLPRGGWAGVAVSFGLALSLVLEPEIEE